MFSCAAHYICAIKNISNFNPTVSRFETARKSQIFPKNTGLTASETRQNIQDRTVRVIT